MEHQRKMSPSPGKHPTQEELPTGSQGGLASLIVMCAVLAIILLFCCFSAPGIRDLCKRYVLRSCLIDDPDVDNIYTRRYGTSRDDIHVISESPKKNKNKLTRQPTQQRQQ